MVYKIEQLPDEPIVIDTHSEPTDTAKMFLKFAEELAGLVQSIEGFVYRIVDMRGMKYNFSELVLAMNAEARSGRPGSITDPRIHFVLVAEGELATLLVESAKQDQYGALDVPLFPSVDEALAYIRAHMAEGMPEPA